MCSAEGDQEDAIQSLGAQESFPGLGGCAKSAVGLGHDT